MYKNILYEHESKSSNAFLHMDLEEVYIEASLLISNNLLF